MLIVINILLLPLLIGVNGIWLSVPVAEGWTLFLVDLLFLEEKRLLSLYKIEKNNVRVMSPDRKIAQIVRSERFLTY